MRSKKEKKKNSESGSMNRRTFVGGVAMAAAGITIVPAYVLGGPRHIAPSDKINVAYIGTGTQGLRELPDLLNVPEAQVTMVCDPQQKSGGYFDWSPNGLLNKMRNTMGNPDWVTGGGNSIPGGRDNGQALVDAYYANNKSSGKYKGCKAYADFREMFAKEKGIDAVKIMATDHMHGVISMAALNRGIPVTMHKPIANRLIEGRKIVDKAIKTDVTTHLIPWDSNGSMDQIMSWIDNGVIGKLKEVHNWSHRPVWPHYPEIPTNQPKVPDGFDWDLWIGPEADRPYHPNYTNMAFRGWYDFGGGAMADMGHYSLWTVFEALKLQNPTMIEPNFTKVCGIKNNATAYKMKNDYSYPFSSTVRFKYPANGDRPPVDLIWYDGGMKPPMPEAYYDKADELPAEGMMFVGESGTIITSEFRVRDPYVLTGDMKLANDLKLKDQVEKRPGIQGFINGVKNKAQVAGSFRQAGDITDAVNLYGAALRAGKTIRYDAEKMEVTNNKEANTYLDRKYRDGWKLEDM
ncbi:MAG: Gfo/Idh/MocA family oxidoreductase [Reichenbachiella sp.]